MGSLPRPISITPTALSGFLKADPAQHIVLDVRRAPAFLDDPRLVQRALRVDPAYLPPFFARLRSSTSDCHQLVMVCVHGHSVSQTACVLAQCHGFQSTYLDGGFEGWKQAGLPLETNPQPTSVR